MPRFVLLWAAGLLWTSSVLAQAPAPASVDLSVDAVQLGAGEIHNGYWYPVPGVRGDVTWLHRYDSRHGYFLRLEGGAALTDVPKGYRGARERAYTATVLFGVREWLGPRRRGFVEVGARVGAVVVVDETTGSRDALFAKELLSVGGGIALGRHHDVDLLFTTSWGFPSGGGVALRVPLWHRL